MRHTQNDRREDSMTETGAANRRHAIPDPAAAVCGLLRPPSVDTRHDATTLGTPAEPVRVIVVAEGLLGEALCVLLSHQPGVEIVSHAADAARALVAVRDAQPDVVLLDPRGAGADATDLIRRIRGEAPDARVLLLVAEQETAAICRALKAGAKGYVSRNASLAAVTKAIRGVYAGDVWVERRLIAEALWGPGAADAPEARSDARGSDALTAREREILRLLAAGGTNRHIAEALFISEKTVKTHLNNIFRKLYVTRRLQAVLYAVRSGLSR